MADTAYVLDWMNAERWPVQRTYWTVGILSLGRHSVRTEMLSVGRGMLVGGLPDEAADTSRKLIQKLLHTLWPAPYRKLTKFPLDFPDPRAAVRCLCCFTAYIYIFFLLSFQSLSMWFDKGFCAAAPPPCLFPLFNMVLGMRFCNSKQLMSVRIAAGILLQ